VAWNNGLFLILTPNNNDISLTCHCCMFFCDCDSVKNYNFYKINGHFHNSVKFMNVKNC